jgi:proteic killer suppression protein
VRIRNFSHKGLQRLYDDEQTKGLPADCVNKLRRMFAVLDRLTSEEQLYRLPVWHAHELKGRRKGTWSFHVTANWRLTFAIEKDEICNVDLEDYH